MDFQSRATCFLILLVLIQKVKSSPISIQVSKAKVVDRGDDVDLLCMVANPENSVLQWYQLNDKLGAIMISNGSELIYKTNRMSITYTAKNTITSVLRIENIQEEDMGFFDCRTISPNVELSSQVQVIVMSGPKIGQDSTNEVLVEYGKTARMQCTFISYPEPSISWSREESISLPQNAIMSDNSLIIPQMGKNDAGTYYCSATNGVGPIVRHRINVILEFPPIITIQRTMNEVGMSGLMDLKCYVDAFPLSHTIKWEKNGKPVTATSHRSLSSHLSGLGYVSSIIHFYSLNDDDFGNYSCEATNSKGSRKTYMDLPKSSIKS